MSISPISSNQYQAQLLALSALQSETAAGVDAGSTVGQSGDIDLLLAEKLYRQTAAELEKLSKVNGTYERHTLTDSEIKSLKSAGVPIDKFIAQHGQKLGSREYHALADLIMKTIEQQAGANPGVVASPTSPAPEGITARAYV